LGVLTPQVGGTRDIKTPAGTRGLVVKFLVCFSGARFHQQLSSTKHTTNGPRYFSEKNMTKIFLLVSNYMPHALGLHGRIDPARKARSPLGMSGNQGFYRTTTSIYASDTEILPSWFFVCSLIVHLLAP
jgi:hypothetical protein